MALVFWIMLITAVSHCFRNRNRSAMTSSRHLFSDSQFICFLYRFFFLSFSYVIKNDAEVLLLRSSKEGLLQEPPWPKSSWGAAGIRAGPLLGAGSCPGPQSDTPPHTPLAFSLLSWGLVVAVAPVTVEAAPTLVSTNPAGCQVSCSQLSGG